MNITHRSIGIAVALLAATSAQAQWNGGGYPSYPAQNSRIGRDAQLVFEWQGRVDRETEIYVGQRNVSVRGVQNNESRGRFVNRGSLPRGGGTLYVQRIDGRGDVQVIQQPMQNGRNGDGIIRITDPRGGADFYDIRVFWQPNGSTTVGRGRNDRDNRDGDWDRGDRNNNGNGRGWGWGRRKHRDRDRDRDDRDDGDGDRDH